MTKTWGELQEIQPIAVRMLQNSINKNRIAHAYLFEGPKGTGKMEMSMQLAKRIFCLEPEGVEPCFHCINCKRIASGNHPDVFLVQPDGLSIKKHQIQALQEEFSKTGLESNKKLYIIEHADKMTANAANSLLKFLEEPSADTVALLLTEQSHQLLDTILSRCQTIAFRPLPTEKIMEQLLGEGISKPLAMLTPYLTNDIEEAISYCRDDWFAQSRALVIKLYEAIQSKQALLFIHEKWMKHFQDREQLQMGLDMLLLLYKDILYMQSQRKESVVFCDQLPLLEQSTLRLSGTKVSNGLFAILEAKKRLNANMNPQLVHEQLALHLQEGS